MTSSHHSADATTTGPLKKRKRASTEPEASIEPGHDASFAENPSLDSQESSGSCGTGQTPTGPKKRRGRPPKLVAEPTVVESDIEWPFWFKELDKTHRALNLVYTFCSTRKHLATTFDTIRSTVESHTNRSLTVEDVAAIVALRPEGIHFAYVDELMLQLDARSAEKDDTFKAGRFTGKSSQSFAPDASVGGMTGLEGLGDADPNRTREDDEEPRSGREVLYFEFIDEDLKRQVQDKKTGDPTKPTRRLRQEDVKMPVYSQKQMTTLIEKRNTKFANAVNKFLNRCAEESTDPEMILRSEAETFIPRPSAPQEETPRPKSSILPASIPKERKSIPEIVQELKDSPWYTGQIVPDGHRVFEEQEPVYGYLNFLLSQDLVNALYNTKGITQFYAHQADAINALHDGHHVVVSTSTSSGKSLIYQLPVVHALEQDRNSRAMYIFPTKALAQDQKRSLKEVMKFMPGLEEMLVETFDGDTPFRDRNIIRDDARIIFTNPDMLHITILPQEERWRAFLQNLKYVVGE